MITLPLLPIWIVDIVGAVLVVLLATISFLIVIRLTAKDPENALYLFLFWFTLALLAFAFFRSAGHILKHVLIFSGKGEAWENVRPWSGGLNSITFLVITAVSLFFYHIQRLYRRMAANHSELEATSREILELNREMEALVIERTMTEMALSVADGIRNPLHIIGGFSQRLLKKTSSGDPARDWAACISREARRLEHMVEHFEALAQKKESFFTEEDLNIIVHDILKLIQEEFAKKRLELVVQLTPDPIWGRFNAYLLKLALAHMLRNAIEATPPQGEVRVTTQVEGSLALLVIQDTGQGMPQEVVDRIFEPFYTTKIGGTGLGMIFVKQIVAEHRGKIDIESREGQGTTATIQLPLRFAESPDLRLSQ
jgi:two-component system, NtrC family, sensor kinase